jgi:hypothetical protein
MPVIVNAEPTNPALLADDWPALAAALDDLAACPELVTLLHRD